MKYLIIPLLLFIPLNSCRTLSGSSINPVENSFTVREITYYGESCKYYIKSDETFGFYIQCEPNKFLMGDTLILVKK